MKIYLNLEAPFEWVRCNGQQVEAFGEVASIAEYPLTDEDEVIGVVPGEWVTSHMVSLPAKTRKQFSAALPYALEEAISEDVDNMHFVCPTWKPGAECLVLVVAKQKMAEWQAIATEHRLPIDRLLPDHSLLPFHSAADCSIAARDNDLLANQRDRGGVTIDQDFLDLWIMQLPMSATIAVNNESLTERLIDEHPERDFRHWPFGTKMAHWLEYVQTPAIDLWSDKFRPKVRRFSLRAFVLPLGLIGLVVFGKFAFDAYRYLALHAEIRAIQTESQAIFKQTLPELGEVALGQERIIMEQAIARLSGADQSRGLPKILAEVANVLRAQNVTIVDFVYRENELQINCKLNDFSQVDQIARQLNARPGISASLQSSASEDGEIIASYLLTQG